MTVLQYKADARCMFHRCPQLAGSAIMLPALTFLDRIMHMTDLINFQGTFHIHVGTWDEMGEQARSVRMKVFVVEQGVPQDLEWDSFDAASQHVLAVDTNGNSIGTGRLLPDGHVGRMAVLPEWRGKGVGAAVLRKLMVSARENGVQHLALNAQIHAIPFYTRFGFVPVGSAFVEAGILHLAMICDLRR